MMTIKMKKKFNQSDFNNKIKKGDSNCSVKINNQIVNSSEDPKKFDETLKFLESSSMLKNFDELIKINADGLIKKQNKNNQFVNLYEKLMIKDKVRLMVRIYKDISSNLNFAFDKKNLDKILDDKENHFWSNFRSKKIKSQQVKNMEYNNIIKSEKIEMLDEQIRNKIKKLEEKKEEKYSEFMKFCEIKQELLKESEIQRKKFQILKQDKQEIKKKILNEFFGKSFYDRINEKKKAIK
jgi:hypothetical protein